MNRFTHFFIDRPIFAAVLSILTVLIGTLSLITLPIAQYPEIAPPSVQVKAIFPGASAGVLAETVATPLEQEINGVEDMLYMSSQSSNDGILQLTVTFKPGANLDKAQIQVQNRVALAEPRLPEEVRRQGIAVRKRSPDLSLVINLISPDGRYDNVYMTNYALLQMRDALARVPGVGDISLFGGREYSMRIWLDPGQVAARGLTASDVIQSIREQNIQVAAGVVGAPPADHQGDFQYTVMTQGRLSDPEEFGDIIIRTGREGQVTRLKDVATIELGSKDYNAELILDGHTSVGLAIFQMPGSNAIATKTAVLDELDHLKARFPEGLDVLLSYDTVVFIEQSIEKVITTLMESIVLVVLVVLLFLRTWRATMIPLLAVPVSLIGTFSVMAYLGLSLNTLSLFGLVLAIGIVVDDAIVVVENVERNMALGMAAKEASRRAMEEVVGPIVATALVLVAVFIPTTFITGVSGAFYKQFALTIAVSTVISAFNSLTLSPALCALLLDRDHSQSDTSLFHRLGIGRFLDLFHQSFDRFSQAYSRVVRGLISRWRWVLTIFLGLTSLNWVAFHEVPTGFIPPQDMGYLIVYAQLPDAASLERTRHVVMEASRIILETEGVAHVNAYAGFSVLGGGNQSNAGTLFTRLTPADERAGHADLQTEALIQTLQKRLGTIDGAYLAVFAPPPVRGLSTVGGFKLQIQDRSNQGPQELASVTNAIIQKASAIPGFTKVFTTFRASVPQLKVDVDRTLAKSIGVPLSNVFQTLQIYLGSLYVNDFNLFGRTYQVSAQADSRFRATAQDIEDLKTRNNEGEMVPLGTLINVRPTTGPDKISHYNIYPAAEINGITLPSVSSGQSIQLMEDLLKDLLPPAMGYEWTELTLQQILAGNTAIIIFPLSVIFVFLALAAQYESWSLPLAVILIVPMCLLSAMSGIWLRGMDNNIFTQIGFIVLVGLACKNAILIVEFARRRQDQGDDRVTAALTAAKLRLRPIVMTSLAFIMGVFPLVIAQGAGSEVRRILGTTVFSGMLGVTVFGLLMTPVFFVMVRALVEKRPPKKTSL
ncbi:MAG: multidrug efflux RND transporter permease subunit [Gammaproteobacteria bacterium]|nr:multidrug efflux RND transporter permease subunit [Gammaproteobacteria bacterium]